jgi:hypothetical protein
MDDLSQGIGGEYTEVLVTVKPHDLELENEIP